MEQNLLSKLQREFKIINCDQGQDHQDEPLNIICIDNRCLDQNQVFEPLCSVCLEQNPHDKRDHKLKNFKRFIKQIAAEIEDQEYQQLYFSKNNLQKNSLNGNFLETDNQNPKISNNQKILDQEKYKIITELEQSRKNIKILKDQCEQICQSITNIISDVEGGESGQISKIKNEIQNLLDINQAEQLRSKLSTLGNLIHLEEDGSFNLAKQMEDKINFVQFNSKHIKEKVDQISEEVKNLQVFTSTLNYKNVLPELKLKQEFNHSTLEIDQNNNQIIKKIDGNCQQTVAVLQRPIKKPIEKFGIKIKEIEGFYNGIGIVSLKKAQSWNYVFNVYNDANHGAYLINQEGRIYSSHNPSINQTSTYFSFRKDDLVFCEVDSIQKTIKFTKKDSNQKQEIQFEFGEDEEVHPCLVLCCEGTQYQLLTEKEILAIEQQQQ